MWQMRWGCQRPQFPEQFQEKEELEQKQEKEYLLILKSITISQMLWQKAWRS